MVAFLPANASAEDQPSPGGLPGALQLEALTASVFPGPSVSTPSGSAEDSPSAESQQTKGDDDPAEGDVSAAAATAVDDSYTVRVGESTLLSPKVTANDSGVSESTHVEGSNADHGTVTSDQDAFDFTYTPDAGYTGPDSFEYAIFEDSGEQISNVATVTITVTDDLIARDDAYTVAQDSGPTTLSPPISDNDSYLEDGKTYNYVQVTDPAHGTYDATYPATYTPDAGFSGTDTFTYRIDEIGSDKKSNVATVTITVTPTDDGEGNGDGEDDLVSVESNCSGDVEFTNTSDIGLEVVYGDLPSDVDGDFVLAPGDTESISSERSRLEFRAEGPGDEFEEGTIHLEDCSSGDEDDDDDDSGNKSSKGVSLPDTGGTASARLLLIAMLSSIGGLFLIANTRSRRA